MCLLSVDQRKALCKERIPKSDCVRKYAADINILITSMNDRKIMHSIRITRGLPTRKGSGTCSVSLDRHIPK